VAYIITHNSPSVGFVSWQDLHMQYNGSTYAIADGNTDKVYVWWELADPYVLKSSNTYPTLGASDALVLLNKNGTAFLVPGSTVLDGSLIVPGTILADALSANSVTGAKILAGAIDTAHLAAYAVTADKIDAEAVTAEKVAANAIGAAAIAAGAILSDHLCAGAVTAGKVAAGAIGATEIVANAITVNKLAVVPYNHNPDPFFNDASLWNLASVWAIVARSTGNVPDLMDVPKAVVLDSTTYSGTTNQGFVGPQMVIGGSGQKLRLSATLYNNSNWSVRVGMYYYNAAGTYLGKTALDLAAGGGVSAKSAIGTTPANTAFVQILGYAIVNESGTPGPAFSGQVAASNIRVEADTELTGTVASESLINEYHDVARYRWNCVDFDKTNSDDILWSIETGQVYEFDPTQNEVRAALRGAVAQVGWTIGAEANNARAIGIQLKDADGQDTIGVKAVTMGVFADANGNAFATTGGSTGIAIGTDGALLALVAKKLFVLTSEADGDIDLTWTDTAAEAVYLGVFLPNGSIAMSPKIQNAA
jgi:hypothetical protein